MDPKLKALLHPKLKAYFAKLGSEGGKAGAKKLTAAQRKEKARAAGIASGKARRKKAKQRQ